MNEATEATTVELIKSLLPKLSLTEKQEVAELIHSQLESVKSKFGTSEVEEQPYYYKVDEFGLCLEPCQLIPDIKIGSVSCKRCRYNLITEHSTCQYILCTKIKEAVAVLTAK
jgi:hypothetical protein